MSMAPAKGHSVRADNTCGPPRIALIAAPQIQRAEYRNKISICLKTSVFNYESGLFANIEPREFKRVLSNLINNAVEAIEGTNAMIDRAGVLCKTGGWTLIKVANSQQDMRMDVPSIGTTTIEKLAAHKAGCLVLEPGKTILLEKQKVLDLADRLKIAVVGYAGETEAQ